MEHGRTCGGGAYLDSTPTAKRQFILQLRLPMIIEMKTLSTCFLCFISLLLLKK